jgi:hypothetical protein
MYVAGFGAPDAKRAAPTKREQQRRRKQGEPQPVWVADSKACPCASGRPYAECCECYHLSDGIEPTAEALMRARFSAYVKGHVRSIITTATPIHTPNHIALSRRMQGWHGLRAGVAVLTWIEAAWPLICAVSRVHMPTGSR